MQVEGVFFLRPSAGVAAIARDPYGFRDHDHLPEVFAVNTSDESLAKPALEFVGGH